MPFQTHQQLHGRPFPVGGEWDAGLVRNGRITVRRTPEYFEVVYHTFAPPADEVLAAWPDTEEGERAAKDYAYSMLAVYAK